MNRLDDIRGRLEHPELFTERDAWYTAVKAADVEYLLDRAAKLEAVVWDLANAYPDDGDGYCAMCGMAPTTLDRWSEKALSKHEPNCSYAAAVRLTVNPDEVTA